MARMRNKRNNPHHHKKMKATRKGRHRKLNAKYG